MNDDANALRRLLGRRLRKARIDKGYTQARVATVLNCGQAKINKIERSLVDVDDSELDMMIRLYTLDGDSAAELRLLAARYRAIRPKRPRFSPEWSAYGELSDDEQRAAEVLCWHSERIPVPLQSEQYRLALCGAGSQTDVTNVLSGLRARTEIFTAPDGPRYRAVLSESSFRRMPNGAAALTVDVAQNLLALMTLHKARLELRILPFDARVRYVDTDFVILRFAEKEQRDYIYFEYPGGAGTFTKKNALLHFQSHWSELYEAALDEDGTLAFLNDLAGKNGRANDGDDENDHIQDDEPAGTMT